MSFRIRLKVQTVVPTRVLPELTLCKYPVVGRNGIEIVAVLVP